MTKPRGQFLPVSASALELQEILNTAMENSDDDRVTDEDGPARDVYLIDTDSDDQDNDPSN